MNFTYVSLVHRNLKMMNCMYKEALSLGPQHTFLFNNDPECVLGLEDQQKKTWRDYRQRRFPGNT